VLRLVAEGVDVGTGVVAGDHHPGRPCPAAARPRLVPAVQQVGVARRLVGRIYRRSVVARLLEVEDSQLAKAPRVSRIPQVRDAGASKRARPAGSGPAVSRRRGWLRGGFRRTRTWS